MLTFWVFYLISRRALVCTYLNGVRVCKAIQTHSTNAFVDKKIGPDIVFRVDMVNTQVLYPVSKTFI